MSNSVTLGGERLGSGKKEKIYLHGFERSTHDLSYAWRSSMSAGTLVPFMSELALPGDDWDIQLDCDVKTLPTIGPLFGSYKVQLDVFSIPIRLYNKYLHMNALGIGLKMDTIGLPTLKLTAFTPEAFEYSDNSQVNPSCILKYLGISGVGRRTNGDAGDAYDRVFNAVPLCAYFDIYKNYYANKQEEIGTMIHNNIVTANSIDEVMFKNIYDTYIIDVQMQNALSIGLGGGYEGYCQITSTGGYVYEEEIICILLDNTNGTFYQKPLSELFNNFYYTNVGNIYTLTGRNALVNGIEIKGYIYQVNGESPRITKFPLENIDKMRLELLEGNTDVNEMESINKSLLFDLDARKSTSQFNQEGLLLKCYQSDLFNNWISTEWLEGSNGINEITAIDTSSGEFNIDTLILSRKVYDMLNRIAISGGTYDDWLDAVYSHERTRSVENPIYHGGLSKELAFEEVVNTSASTFQGTEQPLGQLAGRGRLTQKNKGGYVSIKVNEPSYIMGIVSLTPRLDYSQGNKWDTNLKTVDDLFKPSLQQIGFQDLITDQMAWWDTEVNDQGEWTYKSAGKQPAWINYMTNYNKTYGNFADNTKDMFMTLNRRYEIGNNGIDDLTTYIDPSKFNNIFADGRLDAQNFWVQIGLGINARRKMSAKVMPNL